MSLKKDSDDSDLFCPPLRGDIKDGPYANRSKEYVWSRCVGLAPRLITPTDIDYAVECNCHFMFFEMKTVGSVMSKGQDIFYKRLLIALEGKAILIVVTHNPVEPLMLPSDITAIQTWRAVDGKIEIRSQDNGELGFIKLYQAFFKWAERT